MKPLDQPSNSALYVQGPVLGAQTGAAIPAGYQGEIKSGTDTSSRSQSSPVAATWYFWTTNGQLTLEPGVWRIEATGLIALTGTWNGSTVWPWTAMRLQNTTNATTIKQSMCGLGFGIANYINNFCTVIDTVALTATSVIQLQHSWNWWASGGSVSTLESRNDIFPQIIKAVRIN
jgi:hypothetical protein